MVLCVTRNATMALTALDQSAGQGTLEIQFSKAYLITKTILFKDARKDMMIMEHFVLKMRIYSGKAAAARYSARNAVEIVQ